MVLFKCVYCLEQKAPFAFNREHVIPQSFGRFQQNLVLEKEVCKDCNDHFGETLDRILARGSPQGIFRYLIGEKPISEMDRTDFQRVTFQVDSDDPMHSDLLTFVEVEGIKSISRVPGLKFFDAMNNIAFIRLDQLESHEPGLLDNLDRSQLVELTYTGTDLAESQKELGRIKAALRVYGSEVAVDMGSVVVSGPGDLLPVRIEVPEDEFTKRAIAKIGFNYLTKRAGATFTLDKGFDKVRRYIRYGEPLGNQLVRRIRKSPLHHGQNEARSRQGHLVQVGWDEGTRVIGWVSLFQLNYFQIYFGSYQGVLRPIAGGHYFDIIENSIFEIKAISRPQELWLPR